jgi:hypothetical protein
MVVEGLEVLAWRVPERGIGRRLQEGTCVSLRFILSEMILTRLCTYSLIYASLPP